MTTAYIALGSNLGDRKTNIEAALTKLRHTPGIEVTKLSSLLENPAIGGPTNSPAFLNAAAELKSTLAAQDLLHRLLQIERELGRARREKWEPRLIDLDLLLYGDEIIDHDNLKVPHPLMTRRDFVLKPLAELAPDLMHPIERKTILELLHQLTIKK